MENMKEEMKCMMQMMMRDMMYDMMEEMMQEKEDDNPEKEDDMPLKKGYSKESVSENIRREMHKGMPQRQAVAIAMDVARKTKRKARILHSKEEKKEK